MPPVDPAPSRQRRSDSSPCGGIQVKILRLPKLEDKVGLKHSAIYEKIDQGEFPRQVPLGPKAVGWLEDEVNAWIAARKSERDAAAGPPSKLKKEQNRTASKER